MGQLTCEDDSYSALLFKRGSHTQVLKIQPRVSWRQVTGSWRAFCLWTQATGHTKEEQGFLQVPSHTHFRGFCHSQTLPGTTPPRHLDLCVPGAGWAHSGFPLKSPSHDWAVCSEGLTSDPRDVGSGAGSTSGRVQDPRRGSAPRNSCKMQPAQAKTVPQQGTAKTL